MLKFTFNKGWNADAFGFGVNVLYSDDLMAPPSGYGFVVCGQLGTTWWELVIYKAPAKDKAPAKGA